MVQQWWTETTPKGCGAFIVYKKLAGVRTHLRQWAKFSFGSIKLKKLALMQEMEVLDIAKESRSLTLGEIQKEIDLSFNLEEIRRQEEIYWRQRSRAQWIKEGDENTKFFHAVANGRKNRNFIPGIIHGGSRIVDPGEIGKVFAAHFNQHFGFQRSSRLRIDFQRLFQLKTAVDLNGLEAPFSVEEIKRAMFDLGGDKAPGPDGFPLHFLSNSRTRSVRM
ncbi:uncharacterized protein LOC120259908 [Dioscorea cayenensis subsp. rotundata]|uniref:Uncharacterized protein LOC120259908 n=1 Tax=Dioscorea cayennensis subsp. rotundata TaxID=55577 RepID=A0AB40B7P6_DIOCR|nr:uncharacterized protein LOC120259908 [Dioscorea cayenensis subsp. rotundata]